MPLVAKLKDHLEIIMSTTETELIERIRQLPPSARAEVKTFLDFLAWRYQTEQPQAQGNTLIAALRGQATTDLTTDEILEITRGEG